MKIVLAVPIYPPEIGGPSIYAQKLKEGLEKKGELIKIVSYQGLKKYPQPLRIFLYFLRLFKNAGGCDLIYAFNLVSCGLPACWASKILRKRLFMRLGGDFLWERAVESGRTLKPLREYYQSPKTLKERWWMQLLKAVFNGTDRIIFTSQFQRDVYLEHFGIQEKKTIIIQNPFPDTGSPNYQLPTANYQLLYAGRLIKLKNLDFLIDAFYGVLSKTAKDLTLKIIGEGPEQQKLKAKSEKLKVNEKIIFSSSVSHQDLLKEIQQSYLCILPSLTEITPNFVLECIKLQKPILLTKETAYREVFKDNLIFIDPQDEKDLKDKILYLLEEKNYLDYLEKIKKIPTDYSWSNVIEKHVSLFKEFVAFG